ncbi:MAG: hypothetical protein K9N09_11710, partial [Candidatus Cloacimonetes bacterium]|nr:hypothetical protein [Candidatus Cloacimonadota bacterium]MCF7869350.1 hypothetical protein [Candidatus Cloacimonadota bacterium]MCF7884745.1 hypothetical protein [Candidatus Cloacimonadota bacterium]
FNVTQTSSFATIEIYNLKGQKIKTFPNLQINKSSNQQIVWDGTDDKNQPVSSGIYFARMRLRPDSLGKIGKVEISRKLLLLK